MFWFFFSSSYFLSFPCVSFVLYTHARKYDYFTYKRINLTASEDRSILRQRSNRHSELFANEDSSINQFFDNRARKFAWKTNSSYRDRRRRPRRLDRGRYPKPRGRRDCRFRLAPSPLRHPGHPNRGRLGTYCKSNLPQTSSVCLRLVLSERRKKKSRDVIKSVVQNVYRSVVT